MSYLVFSWRNGELEDSCLVEGGNVVIGAGGDNGADSSWIPGLKIEEVRRSRQGLKQFERKEGLGFHFCSA